MNAPEKIYYPNGCPLCKGKVKFDNEHYKYKCRSCDAYADCHREDSQYAKKYEPTEIMAGQKTHFLRDQVRNEFSKLYREKINIKVNSSLLTTSLINIIYTDHIMKYKGKNHEMFAAILKRNDEYADISEIDTGQLKTILLSKLEPISNRDKALIWLSYKMGLETTKCNIGTFTDHQLKIAYKHIYKAILEATKKANDSF